MFKKKINSTQAYVLIGVVSFFTLFFLYVKLINVNTELDNIGQDAGYVMIKVKENSITPKLKSITVGNNGKLQIRGFAPSVWISEGQMSAQIIKDGESVNTIVCYAEGAWVTQSTVPFICETDSDYRNAGFSLKITKDYPSGEEGEAKQVVIPLE